MRRTVTQGTSARSGGGISQQHCLKEKWQSRSYWTSQAASYGRIPTLRTCALRPPTIMQSWYIWDLPKGLPFLYWTPKNLFSSLLLLRPVLHQTCSFPSLSPPPHCFAACIPHSKSTAWIDCQFDAILCFWIQCSQEHYYRNLISWEIDQVPLTEWNTNVLYDFLEKACVRFTIRFAIYRVVIQLLFLLKKKKKSALKQLALNNSIKI